MQEISSSAKQKNFKVALIGLIGAFALLIAGQHCNLEPFFSALIPTHLHCHSHECNPSPQPPHTSEVCCLTFQAVPTASIETNLITTLIQFTFLPQLNTLFPKFSIIAIGILDSHRSFPPPHKVWISSRISRAPPSII